MTKRSEISLRTADLYYVCQVIDGVVKDPFGYIRNIEDALGDARSAKLAEPFSKYSALHYFISEVLVSLIFEEVTEFEKSRWFIELAKSNGIQLSHPPTNVEEFWSVIDIVASQVFHVLFANRGTLLKFNELCAGYVLSASLSFAPERFSKGDTLKRVNPPSWAKSAVFHRDKGRCTHCGCDLTKTINALPSAQYDHIVPLSRGGMNDVTNLQLLCSECNAMKGASPLPTRIVYDEWYPGAFIT